MVNRLTSGTCVLLVGLLALSVRSEAADLNLWQGAFKTASMSGAMELRVTRDGPKEEARLKFAPDARPLEPDIRELNLTDRRISFITTITSTRYRFEGRGAITGGRARSSPPMAVAIEGRGRSRPSMLRTPA